MSSTCHFILEKYAVGLDPSQNNLGGLPAALPWGGPFFLAVAVECLPSPMGAYVFFDMRWTRREMAGSEAEPQRTRERKLSVSAGHQPWLWKWIEANRALQFQLERALICSRCSATVIHQEKSVKKSLWMTQWKEPSFPALETQVRKSIQRGRRMFHLRGPFDFKLTTL